MFLGILPIQSGALSRMGCLPEVWVSLQTLSHPYIGCTNSQALYGQPRALCNYSFAHAVCVCVCLSNAGSVCGSFAFGQTSL